MPGPGSILGSRVYTPKIGTMNEAWFKGVHIGVLMKSRSQNNFDSAHSIEIESSFREGSVLIITLQKPKY